MAAIKKQTQPKETWLEKWAFKTIHWIGTTQALIVHTIFFIGIFVLYLLGVEADFILLILTTIVSLEAIYLSLFLQMAVNRQTESLQDVGEDIEEIQEDVEGLEGDFGEIQEDVEGLEGNVKKIRLNVKDLEADVEDISEDIDRYYLDDDNKEASQEKIAHVESSKSLQNIEREIISLSKGIIALRDDLEALKKNLP
ncbi:MAG TPA: hypothetical protein VHE53_04795 [Patescibacteria group bacterium]|nr:hypothetical protein [Patescibacteria group bacterium]